jgi:nucleoside triphosphate diphosphatase
MENMTPSRDIAALIAIMRRLRDPQTGCPWDKVQTFETVAPFTIEEAYEVAAAIEEKDPEHLREELGDLLFQAVFHARMAEERGLFDFGGVVEAVTAKMIHRHPHVFGDGNKPADATAQTAAWEALKGRERAKKQMRLLDDVPVALPALTRAVKLQKRAGSVGFDWNNAAKVVDKVAEEAGELVAAQTTGEPQERIEEEFGDLLFVLANLARHLKIDPEKALRVANAKFVRRFNMIEDGLAAQGKRPRDATLDEMEALWQAAKKTEKYNPQNMSHADHKVVDEKTSTTS